MTDSLSKKRAAAGRKGGKSKSVKGIRKLSPEKRGEIGRKAAKARWAKVNNKLNNMNYEDIAPAKLKIRKGK